MCEMSKSSETAKLGNREYSTISVESASTGTEVGVLVVFSVTLVTL